MHIPAPEIPPPATERREAVRDAERPGGRRAFAKGTPRRARKKRISMWLPLSLALTGLALVFVADSF